ncbi:GGDEF domain-containing protein [Enterobacteriaceae bacterium H20N1]|uniref:diguanylate cyclase n=1 Tax=Dryocola boscaweniae TaxID=2925397 RepID=A0A9X2W9Q3_9ENTR|nr:GGDEF domain-containing protein [Dryocola boscaweniae]MCT4701894.1 GGDEF domain-containing protein [Dryocola boscaweniae]MCT4719062.1 GGDEF domain-containing protein [Dryocola boscaweniae]
MSAKNWRALNKGKHQLSLRLFLLLNAISACFSMVSPIYHTAAITVPVVLVLLLSTAFLIWQLVDKQRLININSVSFLLGVIWAWHVVIKNNAIPATDASFLIIALLSILFIGSISFINNLQAFILHCLPVALTIAWLDQGEHWPRVLYSIALPAIGITIQHIIQRRNDKFTQRLMNKLLEEKETLNDLSMIDPLTGLYNRRGFQNRLENVLAAGSGNHYVLLLDIDHFKAYNDNYGHSMGDQALIRVSAAIRDAVRSRDIVTRYGGEEFMVLLTNIDADVALQTAERIRQRVYDLKILHLFNEQVATNVTISIGLSPLEDDGIDEALRMADQALYRAKGQGRNNILTSDSLQAA